MDLFKVCLDHLRPADVKLYKRLEREWKARQREEGLSIKRGFWTVPPLEAKSGDSAPTAIDIPIDCRVWAVLACIQSYLEWRDAEIGDARQIDSRYRTLREWMDQQLYCIFVGEDGKRSTPVRWVYAQWLHYGLDAGLQQAIFGKVTPRAQAGVDVDAEDVWICNIESLLDIAGGLTIEAALAHIPEPARRQAWSYRDHYLRGRALRFAQRVFPEWIGRVLSKADEEAVLRRLVVNVQDATSDDLKALEWYGLSLSIELSDAAWAAARFLVETVLRRRTQGPDSPRIARFRIVPAIHLN